MTQHVLLCLTKVLFGYFIQQDKISNSINNFFDIQQNKHGNIAFKVGG